MLACQKQGLVDQLEKDRYNNIMGIVSYYLPTVVAVLPFTSIAPYNYYTYFDFPRNSE